MLLDRTKKIIISLFFSVFAISLFAATTDLATKFLDKANEAYEDDNIEDAYKYVNQALAVAKDEDSQANVLYFARTVYTQKLKLIQEKYDDMAMIDIQENLNKYPNIENSTIKKLIKQIEQDQSNKEKAAEKADKEQQRKVEQERFEAQQESWDAQTKSMDAQTKAFEELTSATKEQADSNKEFQQKQIDAMNAQTEATKQSQAKISEYVEENKKSNKIIVFSILGIALVIVLIVFLIMMIIRRASKVQQIQQEQYVQAFKMLAANQNQTNRLMLGGVTDLYGANPQLRLAGSSTWASAQALPDIEFSENDEEELKQLAVKCEEIGAQIDSATGRKNNSKNVSELVYKLSNQLGLPQGMSMLNFCASMIYDAGFLDIDPDLLTATTLSDDEKKALQEHVNLSEKHLDFVPKKYWTIFEDAAMKHHENMDGSGYPNGLMGDDIPQVARLIHVAESYVSLSSKRSFRDAMDKETAVQKLREQPGIYDQEVVEALDKIV